MTQSRPPHVSKKGPAPKRIRAYRRGLGAEHCAAWFLRLKGWRVLAQRYQTPVGEIDLIVRKRDVLAFVEVKARSDLASGLTAVTPKSQTRISRAARLYLSRSSQDPNLTLRFDVVVIRPLRLPLHLANAFQADG